MLICFFIDSSQSKMTPRVANAGGRTDDVIPDMQCEVISSASRSVRDLGVFLDGELSMKKHISKVTGACYFHLRRLKTVRRILGEKTTATLV